MKKAVIETIIPVKIRDNLYLPMAIYPGFIEDENIVFVQYSDLLVRCENFEKAEFQAERIEFKILSIL